ncbi:hypothetical protein [Microbacterium kyungheense]|uniref:HK97 gp10 family phage protein n=1 Tax=Microbacterium kyungheense TaxID=1263636 RepID=A0A543EU58_9MICO|nr:hypothetical protein [Microbacterium kyungheense]TQM25115.1 hypothetical protein FB391_2574 [Microbacterium kyungheense]
MIRVSAYSSRELLAVLRGLRNLDRETKKQLRGHLRPMVLQVWQQAVAERASTKLQRVVLADTARAKVSDQNVRLTSAQIGRARSGGLKPSQDWQPVEFGAGRSTRNAKAFGPPNRSGKVVYPAAASVIPRVLAMYVQTFVRAIHEALEGKAS